MESKKSVLLDTNVSLDETLEREPFLKDADHIFALATEGCFTAYISGSSITDIFYTLRKKFQSKEAAMRKIEHLLTMVRIAPVDDAIIRRAVSLHWPDFEDAVQYTAAEALQADFLITRDKTGYLLAPVEKIITPADFIRFFTEGK
jgi:predicted nucleic acid-binding protein